MDLRKEHAVKEARGDHLGEMNHGDLGRRKGVIYCQRKIPQVPCFESIGIYITPYLSNTQHLVSEACASHISEVIWVAVTTAAVLPTAMCSRMPNGLAFWLG